METLVNKTTWKDIPGLEGKYQSSVLGEIKSNARFVFYANKKYWKEEKILSQMNHTHGYKIIFLEKGFTRYVHRIIALTFIPNLENKKLINHINGIKSDNRVENLEWCTSSENNIHAYSTGLMSAYERSGNKNPRYKHGRKTLLNISSVCLFCEKEFIKKYGQSICCSRSCTTSFYNRKRSLYKQELASGTINLTN